MRVALLLLMLLAVAAVPGSVFPQRAQSPENVAQYLLDHPDLGPWLDRLGMFAVYSSVWFSQIGSPVVNVAAFRSTNRVPAVSIARTDGVRHKPNSAITIQAHLDLPHKNLFIADHPPSSNTHDFGRVRIASCLCLLCQAKFFPRHSRAA